MHEALQAFHRLIEDVTAKFGGTVAARLDGLVVAYFGWPEAHDDDAERAVRAGKEMLEGVADLSAEHLDARAAAAFGTVIVDPSFGGEVSGDALRSARKMASASETGRLLIDAGTAELVGHAYHLTAVEAASAGSAPIFFVGSAIDSPTRFDARASGIVSPFVGRQAELALLADRWRLAEAREGQAVLIRGEPGIGKSRLVREFIKANDLSSVADVIQSLPFHTNTPLQPFAAHLESLTRTRSGSNIGWMNHDEAHDLLQDLVRGAERADHQTWSARDRRSQALRLYARLLLSPATEGTRLLVIEDIHWLDPSSFELLTFLLELHGGMPTLLLLTSRDHPVQSPDSTAGMTAVTLGPLRAADGHLLVSGVAENELDAATLAEIIERSGGIPLFMEELAQSIAEVPTADCVDPQAGTLHSARPVPLTLQQTIAMRLEGLGSARRTAQAAAVIGRTFDKSLLRALSRVPRAKLDEDWQRLATSSLFRQVDERGKSALQFKHALVCDAAYESLLLGERRSLHDRLAHIYREPDSQAHDSLIAQNAQLAGLWEIASQHFRLAGEDSRARWALTEAIAHLERAVDCYKRSPADESNQGSARWLIETTLLLCECLYFTGAFQRSFDTLEALRTDIEATSDYALRGRAWSWLARLASRLGGRHELTMAAARAAISDSLAVKDTLTTGNAFSTLSVENFFMGRPDESVAAGRRAIDFLSKLPASEALGFAHHYIAIAHVLAGRFSRAVTSCQDVIRIGEELNHPRLVCYGHSIRGWATGFSGSATDAERDLEMAIECSPDHASRTFAFGYLGHFLVEVERYDQAVPRLERAVRECRHFPSPQYSSLFGAVLARALVECGDTRAGREIGEKAVSEAAACAFSFAQGLAVRHLACIEDSLDSVSTRIEQLQHAAAMFQSCSGNFEHARTLLALASLAERAGRLDIDVDLSRRQAAGILRQLGATVASRAVAVDVAATNSRKPSAVASANSGSLT